ncbi:helix-turn-helix domain-containing protein [Microbacterium lushaniae]|uniref:Helix-turn-helix transcriptional regulator n=1 Tax=Microbacterium lushaniae TaxID=2614639 RepID=A0A5J5JFB2_9MICO|nr:helix-turn-helix transcriptional regulator [Microbacterium lushaniae]KAA9150973.1 helix-turn-helix transcriptional regulator [Microbacterium lushaniae]KAA9152017.1 helix-turn-helix transcriptional regulator [Microbacterium lushaniae]QEW03048.1 helix-turn-helix transcriptional regulator [Microbacterium lushaniae]
MNVTRIVDLRQQRGWTQERLAAESGVGLRTIQRLEAGQDASLETLSLVAGALRVEVRDLFAVIDDAHLSSRVESLEARAEEQQAGRDRIAAAWRWLYVGVGIVLSLLAFTLGPYGLVLFLAYWSGGYLILLAIRRIYLEPRLEARFPLARSKRQRRAQPTPPRPSDVEATEEAR